MVVANCVISVGTYVRKADSCVHVLLSKGLGTEAARIATDLKCGSSNFMNQRDVSLKNDTTCE